MRREERRERREGHLLDPRACCHTRSHPVPRGQSLGPKGSEGQAQAQAIIYFKVLRKVRYFIILQVLGAVKVH